MPKFILITSKDPWLQPTGGTSAFSKQILQVFKDEIAIASMSTEDFKAGVWINRKYQNTEVKYLCLGKNVNKKRFLPARIYFSLSIIANNRNIKKLGIQNIFIDSPETVFVLSNNWKSVCYMFHGLNNPVTYGRYKSLQWIGKVFEKLFIFKLNKMKPNCILAAADTMTINNYYDSTGFNKKIGEILSFPTRVDNEIFFPVQDVEILKKGLKINNKIVFTTTGRLAWIKGWDLLLDTFKLFNEKHPDSILIFVGDGEDRLKIEDRAKILKIENKILITGFVSPQKVAEYINVADLCLVGSYREGWSVAMCEMLACGKGMITTNVSGASEMILNEQNGYIIDSREPEAYLTAIIRGLKLENKEMISLELSKRYWLSYLQNNIKEYWKI